MRNYQWWKSKKKRIQKKYTLLLSQYLSPKEVKDWYKKRIKNIDNEVSVDDETYII